MATINTWHICIQGFLQKSSGNNGIARLSFRLIEMLSPHPEHRVELLTFDSDCDNMAETIFRYSYLNGVVPTINIYGYSWGGMATARLCQLFRERGLPVNSVVLADPVYRHWYWLGQWRAFIPWIPIKIVNVKNPVWWSRQFENYPRAHNVIAGDGSTKVLEPVVLTATHANMDDQGAFLRQCEDAARATIEVR